MHKLPKDKLLALAQSLQLKIKIATELLEKEISESSRLCEYAPLSMETEMESMHDNLIKILNTLNE